MILQKVCPVSMIDRKGRQRIDLWLESDEFFHGLLSAEDASTGEKLGQAALAARPGDNHCVVMLPPVRTKRKVLWRVMDREGAEACRMLGAWAAPRKWTIYLMVSSHTDIGLHNSQYIQRYNSSRFVDMAMQHCDETEDREERDRYHYVMEGTWFWENYGRDRGRAAAEQVVENYIQKGKIGLCVGVAGNHTQTFGLEEMCRAAGEKRRMEDTWHITGSTMSMIDNNGLSWGMVQPFAEAGYRNIIFAPNQWNPLYSTVWHMEGDMSGATWNPEAGGGGAYIDLRYSSALPRVFFWEGADRRSRLLVWAGGNYGHGADVFGLRSIAKPSVQQRRHMEERVARQLPVMENKVPYDLWLTACYEDDLAPDMGLTDTLADWNKHWAWPVFSTCGNPDLPFEELRERFEKDIPVLRGDITGGWYQHPLSAAGLLADKLNADRLLTTAEKAAAAACVICPGREYPAEKFRRAWDALMWNDEHSYGTSGYQGRRVYETWMQHRDWINKARKTAEEEITSSLRDLDGRVSGRAGDVIVFNPSGFERTETVTLPDGRAADVSVPAFGYRVASGESFEKDTAQPVRCDEAPVIENTWYRIAFDTNGGIKSVFDKELGRELADLRGRFGINAFVYTRDNHRTYSTPAGAAFTVEVSSRGQRVTACLRDEVSGADIRQEVFLPDREKRVDIDNHLYHVSDMFNTDRYYRYAYYAFDWAMDHAKRYCHLNGCVAEYAKDVTGHGTDTYMPSHEWCCAEQDGVGIGMTHLDSHLVEFDHIHPDKTDCGDTGPGGGMYYYLANDWLQMHAFGGRDLNFRFRYSFTSYRGTWQEARIPVLAERSATPFAFRLLQQAGAELPKECSLAETEDGCRLINVKRAEDGRGLIARLYSLEKRDAKGLAWPGYTVSRCSVDERPLSGDVWQGFETLRIGEDTVRIPAAPVTERTGHGAAQAVIGEHYTGLINHPRAARGENEGHLYLLWGAVTEPDLAGYEVFRGTSPDFVPDRGSLIATVLPEEYCVGRYSDTGLEKDTVYYYRVRACDREGRCGPLSEVFWGHTKE